MKTRFLILIIAVLLGWSAYEYLFFPRLARTDVERSIESGTVTTPFKTLSVHSGEQYYLKCGGKTYFNVRGLEPFYINVPGTESILFVTESASRSVTFHIFDTNTQSEIEISGGTSAFGSNLNANQTPGSAYSDFIEKASDDEIVLATQYPEFKKLTFLDLKHKRVERVESERVDESGHIQRHVY